MKNEKENVNMENIDIQQINDSHKAVILTFNSCQKPPVKDWWHVAYRKCDSWFLSMLENIPYVIETLDLRPSVID